MADHCGNVERDRQIGTYWERRFGELVGHYRRGPLTPHQIGMPTKAASFYMRDMLDGWNQFLLPDITIWRAPGEHHEIKHKNPTRAGTYGLECYRLEALCEFARETGQLVLYTIHDWEHAGARSSRERTLNRIADWFTANVLDLQAADDYVVPGGSYVNGTKKIVPIRYWPTSLWTPLDEHWNGKVADLPELPWDY